MPEEIWSEMPTVEPGTCLRSKPERFDDPSCLRESMHYAYRKETWLLKGQLGFCQGKR